MQSYENWVTELLGCQKCKLCQTRTQVVVADGSVTAPIMLIGEAPGADEDSIGLPFIGRSGQLLRTILREIGLSLKRDVYITNIVKCRPPNNRDPEPDELNICGRYLIDQITTFANPSIIVGIGRISSGIMMKGYIHDIHHGKIFNRGRYDFMGTYHPAAALRNPGWKRKMVSDLTLLNKYKSEKF